MSDSIPPHSLREPIAAAIEALIAVLDAIDADPDLEPEVDEEDGCLEEFDEGRLA